MASTVALRNFVHRGSGAGKRARGTARRMLPVAVLLCAHAHAGAHHRRGRRLGGKASDRWNRCRRRRVGDWTRKSDRAGTDAVQIVLPTTYSGSEMTDIVGQTTGGVKQTSLPARTAE